MPDMKQIHNFAVKWCDKFRDQNINYIDLVDHYMADDCAALGFEMDCGHAFSEKYGQAANNHEALNRIIYDVTDIPLLGSAIYSQWRYFNHWAYDAAEILEPQNRAWFILALSRLALLSGENPFIFQGTLKRFVLYQIISVMVQCRILMTKWNNTLPSMMKVAFGFLDITLVTVEKDTKKHEVRFLKLKKLLLTDYSVQLQLILATNTMKFFCYRYWKLGDGTNKYRGHSV